MTFPTRSLMYGVIICLCATAGCGGRRGREPRTYTRAGPRDPVAEARIFFEGYVHGQGLGSEQELFEELISAAKAADPAKGAVIKRGFAGIKANPEAAADTAKKALDELR